MLPRDYSLSVWNPIGSTLLPFVPVDSIKLDNDIKALTYGTQIGVGYNTLSLTLDGMSTNKRRPWLAQPYNLPPLAHLELSVGNTIVWEGRRVQPAFTGASFASLTAFGYGNVGLKDAPFVSQAQLPTDSLNILLQCLNAGPVVFGWANSQDLQAPAFQTNLSALSGQMPASIIDQLSKAGDGAQLAWDFCCWDGRNVTFKPRQCPLDSAGNYAPDYLIDFDDDALSLVPDETDLYGAVMITYTNAASGLAGTPIIVGPEPTFQDRYGLLRTGQLSAGTTTAATATAIGWVWVYQHAWPVVRATLKRQPGEGLRRYPLGDERPPQFVRAGEWVQIGADPQLIPPQIITRTELDCMTDTLTVELGAAPLSQTALVSELRSALAYSKQGRSVVSGGAL